jgi:probable rRNA maturation factor
MSVRIDTLVSEIDSGLYAEVQISSAEVGIPKQVDFDHWLGVCFGEEPRKSIVIRIVDRDESAALNQQYRDKSEPTNILSFPYEVPPGIFNDHLGDLVVCASLVRDEASVQNKPVMSHWAHLLIHGVLHLQGLNHIEPKEARQMELKEIALLSWLGISNPYLLIE